MMENGDRERAYKPTILNKAASGHLNTTTALGLGSMNTKADHRLRPNLGPFHGADSPMRATGTT
jgi:hypothetical protein